MQFIIAAIPDSVSIADVPLPEGTAANVSVCVPDAALHDAFGAHVFADFSTRYLEPAFSALAFAIAHHERA